MVIRKNLKNRHVFISVYDKKNLEFLCKNLQLYNYKFISTGKTAEKIRELGFNCLDLSKVIKTKEILDGRVKSLDSKLYGSILFNRDSDKQTKEFDQLNIPRIDIVIVNFYPFKKFLKKNDDKKLIEMIDIGGPSVVRAAAKNYKFITVINKTENYKRLISNLTKNSGVTDLSFRKLMAGEIFKSTYSYDTDIYNWFVNSKLIKNKINLRYGENPKDKAFLINSTKKTLFDFKINGKNLGYNNILDIDSGFKCLAEFKEPTCVIVKHASPCGVASANNIYKAFEKSFNADNKSAFGGIVLLNRKINKQLADILSKNFFEIIVASKFEKKASEILKKKKNLVLIELNKLNFNEEEYKSTIFGMLYQKRHNNKINKNFIQNMSFNKKSEKYEDDIIFGLKVAKHLKSNAIVLSKNKQTIGIGQGQTNRIDALKIAINKMKFGFNKKNYVCVSDGFFPFTDSIRLLKNNGCKIITQPSGSKNDKIIIDYAIKNRLSLYFIKERLFRH